MRIFNFRYVRSLNNIMKFTVKSIYLLISSLQLVGLIVSAARVVDLGPKLPKFIEEHPDKSWLVKFYVPWCHHCTELEHIYNNLAEKIYHRIDNLIVGQMDCTKYGEVCEMFNVDSYPYILYVNKHSHFHYKGERIVDSMFDFAERVHGPDVKTIEDCKIIKELVEHHGLLILGGSNLSSDFYEQFKHVARSLKSHFWFYHSKSSQSCQGLYSDKGLYLFKRYLHKPIKFTNSNNNSIYEGPKLKQAITEWIAQESYPVYGPINYQNFDQRLSTGKILAIAALDLYTPAGMLSQSSSQFRKSFEKFVKLNAQNEEQILYAWSTDIELLQSIAIRGIPLPNVILIRPDYSYHLMIEENIKEDKNTIPKELRDYNLRKVISAAKSDNLSYNGGNSIVHKIFRKIYTQYSSYKRMFEANPLLATVLLGLPFSIMSVVFYTTCRDEQVCPPQAVNEEATKEEASSDDDEDIDIDESPDEENQALLCHAKQE